MLSSRSAVDVPPNVSIELSEGGTLVLSVPLAGWEGAARPLGSWRSLRHHVASLAALRPARPARDAISDSPPSSSSSSEPYAHVWNRRVPSPSKRKKEKNFVGTMPKTPTARTPQSAAKRPQSATDTADAGGARGDQRRTPSPSKPPNAKRPLASAPFSSHARGVPLFDRSMVGAKLNLTQCLLDLRDMGSSIFWFLGMQTWLTFWSALVNILSLCFFNFYRSKSLGAPINLVAIEMVVVLPMIGFIWMLQQRRDKCLDLLTDCKTGFLFLTRRMVDEIRVYRGNEHPDRESSDEAHSEASMLMERTRAAVSQVITGMHEYFLPSRFYATRYPYLGYKAAMYQIALDRSTWQKQIRRGIEELDGIAKAVGSSNNSDSRTIMLLDMVYKLHTSIDKLSNVKEFGTPQGIRAMVRCYVTLIIPLFFAPYWAYISENADFAVAFFVSLAFQVALTGLLNVAITLEDPFDNVGMGGIFVDEQLHEIEAAVRGFGDDTGDLEGQGGVEMKEEARLRRGEANGSDGGQMSRPVVRVATDNV